MSRSRDLANLAGDATGLETLTVSDITDLTATTTELNYVDGVTSAVQTQLNQLDSQTSPHIIPGVLYPAIGGKGIDGTTTVTSFGTDFAISGYPTLKYYYTDIKGSKPIKDPRIGGHFGSQRHRFKSLQLLEQETATHGKNVYSVDGREWIRIAEETNGTVAVANNAHGNKIDFNGNVAGTIIEITGYFNDANLATLTDTNRPSIKVSLNGTQGVASSSALGGVTTVGSPIKSRYVPCGSLINIGDALSPSFGNTPQIYTLTLEMVGGSHYGNIDNIELITQDTSNRNNIQIPSQDVVSYGKKFNVSGTPHYDPLTTMSYGGSGTTLSNLQSLIDTDTSLGMDAWKAGTSNYHRPWNGGRVIKWVDSSGTIKTSVNMMPPNAQNIGTTASNAVSDAHVIAGTNDDTINFNTSAIDHTQAEVAKTFHFREFGNGNANGGPHTGSENPPYADASMVTNSVDNIAYVMDDGLTSLSASGAEWNSSENFKLSADTNKVFITFIGTGLSIVNQTGTIRNVAQNLPYGTHVFSIERTSSSTGTATLDGIAIQSTHANWDRGIIWSDITFHQPKKPPIPEDACVLADYMLMADFVAANASHDNGRICKGVRRTNGTRDHLYDSSASVTSNVTLSVQYGQEFGFWAWQTGSATGSVKLPFFGTRFTCIFDGQHVSNTLTIDGGSDTYSSGTIKLDNATTGNLDGVISPVQTLGIHNFTLTQPSGSRTFAGTDIATPIHTSFHYQSFETPFLHELVGGDRNMEQHNLVCSPDGKSWDELTRDTSYIGNIKVCTTSDTDVDWSNYNIFDEWRGTHEARNWFNKDFAIAYDRMICLRDGFYQLHAQTYANTNGSALGWYVNTSLVILSNADSPNHIEANGTVYIKRGDYVQLRGEYGSDSLNYNIATITRV